MAREDENAVEEAVGNGVGLGKIEGDAVGVELAHADGFAFQHEERALRGVNPLIQDGLKGKNDIVGIERVAVGELDTLAQFKLPMKPVAGHFPGFGKGGFGSQ